MIGFDLGKFCDSTKDIMQFIGYILTVVKLAIPLLIIAFCIFDLGKAVMSSDDKEIKGATSKLIKRVIYAVAIFFVVTIVTLVMNLFANVSGDEHGGTGDTTGWGACWDAAGN